MEENCIDRLLIFRRQRYLRLRDEQGQDKCLDALGILAHFSGFGYWLPIESQEKKYISIEKARLFPGSRFTYQ